MLRRAWLLAFFLWPSLLPALDSTPAITQYSHRVWLPEPTEDALPQNSVFSILQTGDGYLWLATQEGLVRFDGVRFQVFNKQNTPEIRHNDVWKLLEDRAGNLWVGTRGGGLVRYKDGIFTRFSKENGLSDDSIQSLWEDRDGALWIGTRGGGLDRYKDGKFSVFTTKDGLSSSTVYSLYGDRDGGLWIGTDGGGVNRFRDGKFTAITTKQGLSNDTVYALYEDREGAMWVGTGAGLNRIKEGKLKVYRSKDGLSNDNIRSVYQDRAGNLWIGTDGGGLNRYRDERFTAFTTKQGLSNDNVGAIYEDREGSLWVGTDAGGLNRFKDNKFLGYSVSEGLSDDNARSVLEDREGSIWVGTFGGVNRYRDGKFTAYTKKDGLSSNVVLSMAQDHKGELWLGTLGGGLNRFQDGKFKTYSKKDGLSNETILSLYEDHRGTLWIGTRSGGLNRFENGHFTAYTTNDGLSSNDVRYITEDRGGSLWIGTLGGGLNRLHEGKFTAYTKKDGLSSDLVLVVHEDDEGTLWIGTFGGGLNRYKNGKFTPYTTRDGLYDDVIFQILEDESGNLWMSSNRGISRVSKKELNNFADGTIRSIAPVAYGMTDGMRSRECNGAHQPAGWKGHDGRLWFPTIRGVVNINPQKILINKLKPPVVIEQFVVDGKQVAPVPDLALPPGRKKLEFHYTALSFLAPEKVQFKYKLEGFDPSWVEAGSKRIAYYTNLPPGSYRFQVLASNNDGVWNETGTAIEFYLQPYFYQTPAFYLVYILMAVAFVLLGLQFYRRRIRQFQAREQELLTLVSERKRAEQALKTANSALVERAADLSRSNAELERFVYVASHDLKEPLRSVVGFMQLLSKKLQGQLDEDARQYIQFAINAAINMRANIDNLLAYASSGKTQEEISETDCAAALGKALENLKPAIAESGAVITHDRLPILGAHPGLIVQLFQNLVGNAIKFRGEQPVRIHVSARQSADQSEWEFTVQDNGIGIELRHADKVFALFQRLHPREEYTGRGVGLAICRKIVENYGGRIRLESTPGQGSRFIFTIPVI